MNTEKVVSLLLSLKSKLPVVENMNENNLEVT